MSGRFGGGLSVWHLGADLNWVSQLVSPGLSPWNPRHPMTYKTVAVPPMNPWDAFCPIHVAT